MGQWESFVVAYYSGGGLDDDCSRDSAPRSPKSLH